MGLAGPPSSKIARLGIGFTETVILGFRASLTGLHKIWINPQDRIVWTRTDWEKQDVRPWLRGLSCWGYLSNPDTEFGRSRDRHSGEEAKKKKTAHRLVRNAVQPTTIR